MFPAPENVALDGKPKSAGCGSGAALHDASVSHGGGDTVTGRHGDALVHSCASYTSYAVSPSCCARRACVMKNTSPPVSEASRNHEGSLEVPEEIKPTQPALSSPARPSTTKLRAGLKTTLPLVLALEHACSPAGTPSGSYSYTSSLPSTSCGTSESTLSKNSRPASERYRG